MERRNNKAMQLGRQSRELSPFTTVRRMMEDMDRVFGGWGGDFGLSALDDEPAELDAWNPQVEIFQRGENLVIRADLPGLESKDVNVEVDDRAITIKGERKTEHEENKTQEGYFHSERSYGSFERRIPLPPGIDRSACEAQFQNGVLEVTLKLPKTAPQRIHVRGSSNVSTSTPSTFQENKTPEVSSQTNPQTPQQTKPQPQSDSRREPAPKSHN